MNQNSIRTKYLYTFNISGFPLDGMKVNYDPVNKNVQNGDGLDWTPVEDYGNYLLSDFRITYAAAFMKWQDLRLQKEAK